MTPHERECIKELLEAATISGVSLETAARSIGEVMLPLTATEVAETCRVHAEELGLDAGHTPLMFPIKDAASAALMLVKADCLYEAGAISEREKQLVESRARTFLNAATVKDAA
jgi:hypothetical protein